MSNILISYGMKERNISWKNIFDNYFYINTYEENINSEELKNFLIENKTIINNNDVIYLISNILELINKDGLLNIISDFQHLEGIKFYYLWTYMQECNLKKPLIKYHNFEVYESTSNKEPYAIFGTYNNFYKLVENNKINDTPLNIHLNKNEYKSNAYIWPIIFNLSHQKISNNYIYSTFCQQNYDTKLVKHKINITARKWFYFLLVIIIGAVIFIYKNLPYPRYFQVIQKML